MKILLLFVFVGLTLSSCKNSKLKEMEDLVQTWDGKMIKFPLDPVFTILDEDTIDCDIQGGYKVLTYVDSTGCTSCKLRLPEWKNFMSVVDSVTSRSVHFLFFLNAKDRKEIRHTLRTERFHHPVCIDVEDSLNKLNAFPNDVSFQTFLLDENNKVIAIGNPVLNTKVRELYLKVIQGKKVESKKDMKVINTEIGIESTFVSYGSFDWQQAQTATFTLKNIGDKPLAIEGVSTSCGCTTVDYPQEPAQPGKELVLTVTYKAEQPEHFSKTVTVYCNAEASPVKLTVYGDAK